MSGDQAVQCMRVGAVNDKIHALLHHLPQSSTPPCTQSHRGGYLVIGLRLIGQVARVSPHCGTILRAVCTSRGVQLRYSNWRGPIRVDYVEVIVRQELLVPHPAEVLERHLETYVSQHTATSV